jgi:cytochrome b
MMPDTTHEAIPVGKSSSGRWSGGGEAANAPLRMRRIRVWDLPTRLFHWAIVVLVATLYATWRMNWMGWHALSGEALLALILFRILWGFFGTETARFARSAASPGKALRHLAAFARREPDTEVGHNHAGAWMVFALLGLLLSEVLTGLYINNDVANEGPFTEVMPAPVANAITDLHAILWDAILVAVVLHIFAILAYASLRGQNLVGPMITGNKCLPETIAAPRIASPWLAFFLFAVAVGAAIIISYAI